MSLPKIFQTTLETIPSTVPYLKVPPRTALVDFLKGQKRGQDLQVGLVWDGSWTSGGIGTESYGFE